MNGPLSRILRALFIAVSIALGLEGRAQSAPFFLQQPGTAFASDGGTFSISAQVATSNFATVTWKVNFPGCTISATATASSQLNNLISATVSFGPVSVADAGAFQLVATNIYGSTLSAVGTLSVVP